MRGNSEAFGARIDRAWSPPTLADVVAEEKENAEALAQAPDEIDDAEPGFDGSPETA